MNAPKHEIIDGCRSEDNVRIDVKDAATGKVLHTYTEHNLVVNAGKDLLRDFLHGDAVTGLTHFGVGNGTTLPALSQTNLVGASTYRFAVSALVKTAQQLQVVHGLGIGDANGTTLTECGVFTAIAAGTMYCRATHTGIAKTAGITITYTWNLTWE